MDDQLIRRHYTATRADMPHLADGLAASVLHIGDEHTVLTAGTGADAEVVLLMAIGSHSTAQRFFHHNPPTPGEVEYAIMDVEDEVNRARSIASAYPRLLSSAPATKEMAEIARIAGVTSADGAGATLSLQAVENMFDLLAALSQGRPASSAGIPNTPAFAATLLILRECMHHLGFDSITLPAAADSLN